MTFKTSHLFSCESLYLKNTSSLAPLFYKTDELEVQVISYPSLGKYSYKTLQNAIQTNNFDRVTYINESFIAFISNRATNTFSIITDYKGSFPHYFCENNQKFVVSSDINKVLKSKGRVSLSVKNCIKTALREKHLFGLTLFNDIFYTQAGTVITYKAGAIKVQSYLDSEYFKNDNANETEGGSYDNAKKVFVSAVESVFAGYSAKLKGTIISDVTSGLDSTFVLAFAKKYFPQIQSIFADNPYQSEDTQIIRNFTAKHGVPLRELIFDAPLLSLDDHFCKMYPLPLDALYLDKYSSYLQSIGCEWNLTGDNGNELFSTTNPFEKMKSNLYLTYYSRMLRYKKRGGDRLLTQLGADLFFNADEIMNVPIFPLFSSNSMATLQLSIFPAYLDKNVHPIFPFADARIIKAMVACVNILKKSYSEITFRKLFLPEVYIQEQFDGRIQDYESAFTLRFFRDVDQYRTILKSSSMFCSEFFNYTEIISLLEKKDTEAFKSNDILGYLVQIIKLELYLKAMNKEVHITITG